MPFRFRCSASLGPLRLNFGKSDLSSVSLGGRGASFNIQVAHAGGPRTTVGLPGTGLSWRVEHGAGAPSSSPAGLPNSRRFRPGQLEAFWQGGLGGAAGAAVRARLPRTLLWELNLITRLLADSSIGNRVEGLLALIETPEAMEAYLLRAQSQDDAKRRAHRCVEAAQEAARLVNARCWLQE
jgi:hypothetical protein